LAVLGAAAPAGAQPLGHDVYFLGEIHDNPAHHRTQADWVAALGPKALVFEMLTPDQAGRVTPALIADAEQLGAVLGWADSGWPEFAMYHPIFAAAPDAAYLGAAVPRDAARAAMSQGVAAAFGGQAARFGLDRPLPDDEQARREALQLRAHCDALPGEMLPGMVAIQRLRDARLAERALEALDRYGAPVAVITGNGHARRDWGAPAALALAAPDLQIFALGQGEAASGPPPVPSTRSQSAPTSTGAIPAPPFVRQGRALVCRIGAGPKPRPLRQGRNRPRHEPGRSLRRLSLGRAGRWSAGSGPVPSPGPCDKIAIGPDIDRGDPCAAFR
jgi:uncharacterized iron-regulated protein